MKKQGSITLETDRILLRKFNIEDSSEAFKNWTYNENVAKYTTWSAHGSTEDTREWLSAVEKEYEDNVNYEWGIVLKETNELIGAISAYLKEEYDGRYEIGYCLSQNYWRQGIATECTNCVMDYLINQEGIKHFIGRHAKLNGASGSVMQKAGFRYINDGWFEKFDKSCVYETKNYYYDVYDNIEKPKKEDGEEIAKLVINAWQTSYEGLIDEKYLNNLDVENAKNRWEKQIEGNNNILVYRENNKILGVITYGEGESEKDKGEVFVLYVKPEEKRKGIGTKLLNTVKQELLKEKYKEMVVWCLDGNKIGEGFYSKSGGKRTEKRDYTVNGITVCENMYLFQLREENEDEIILVKPTKEYEEQAIEYKKEHIENGENKIHACAKWDKMENYDEWIKQVQNNWNKETADKNWTVTSTFFGVRKRDGKIVGMIDIRHELNSDYLRSYAGNIGYGVRPSERRKGYATQMLARGLAYCKEEIGLDKVMIGCYKSNDASRKTIVNAGGVLEREYKRDGEITQTYWIKL